MKTKFISIATASIVTIALILAACAPSATHSNTYYVAKTGLDTNDGSFGNPWLTIQHGISQLSKSGGDTLYVRTGTYNERVDVDNILGTVNAVTTISTYNNESVIIDGTNVSSVRQFDLKGSSYIVINGLCIVVYPWSEGWKVRIGDRKGSLVHLTEDAAKLSAFDWINQA